MLDIDLDGINIPNNPLKQVLISEDDANPVGGPIVGGGNWDDLLTWDDLLIWSD